MQQHLSQLESKQKEMLDFTIAQANINSGSFNAAGVAKVAENYNAAFSEIADSSQIHQVAPYELVNQSGKIEELPLGPLLQFKKRSDAPFKILFAGHMDTVFAPDHEFQQVTQLDNNTMNGPGMSDMKGGITVILNALTEFEKSNFKNNIGWEVLLTSDEEIGSFSSDSFLTASAKNYDVGLVYEPATNDSGALAGTRKGSGKFQVVVNGIAAHAGREFHKGKNAITKLARVITEIDNLNGKYDDVTINVGQIIGGAASNIVADSAKCELDIRLPDTESEQFVQQELDQIVAKSNQEEGYKVTLHGQFGRPAKKVAGELENLYKLVQNVGKKLGQDITWQATGGCCDGNNLYAAGLPNVDTLGVIGGKIHSKDEYMFIDSLVTRSCLSFALLCHFSEHGLKYDK